ncbi:AAA family ATPase [Candidatus Uabimicrobium sp. HlEnr_7]|uniref:ATP-binding protein n=1 Tax=Candidatus Uabimicrobium helgolandensis TaxID=3095367 RepID=UPI003557DC12
MAKRKRSKKNVLRRHAEELFKEEIAEIKKQDKKPCPTNWKLSPWAVKQYILGCKLTNGFQVSTKYFGNEHLVEIAVATLATDRALLLYGLPGTAKSWLSEHLAAAISGDSTLLIQGTAGIDEATLRYNWNYARLLAEGPSEDAMIASPIMKAMQVGQVARVEELTRVGSDVQDTLITILSEKILPIPELNTEVQAQKGFNLIATANNKDKGVNEISSALSRRFNTVILPLPNTLEEEVKIVSKRVADMGKVLDLPAEKPALEEIRRVVTIFQELRSGLTKNKNKIKKTSGTLSTAEAISVINSGMAMAAYFGNGVLQARDLASAITGAIVKDPIHDKIAWKEYLKSVAKNRAGWSDLYKECCEVL